MNRTRVSTKILSGALSAAITALSFAVPAAPALAAELTATPTIGLPSGGWTPVVANLANPAIISRYAGATIQGVDVADLLTQLGRVNLAAPGQFIPAQAVDRLAALPKNASESQIVAALASAAAQARADADAVLARLRAGVPASQLGPIAERLKSADLAFTLLTAEQRATIPAASAAVARERARTTSANASRLINVGVTGWQKTEESIAVPGTESSSLSRLSPSTGESAKPAPAVSRVTRTTTHTKTTTSSFDWKQMLRYGALAAAVPVAILAFPQMSPVALIVSVGVMGSVIAHEFAHLIALRRLGDDTSTKQNFSLNPLKLVDPVGTVAVPVITSALSTALGLPILFGWAKPVPVDFNKLADPQKDTMKVALAGPLMNVALAGVGFAALALFHPAGVAAASILALAKINVVLAAFNMLPLSPQMDGFKVALGFAPRALYQRWTENKRLPEAYRSTFTKMYEGPSMILNLVGMDGQGKVNFVTRAITFVAFGAVALAVHAYVGVPLLLMMLVCSYDYYCIREKIQNEEAVKKLIPIMQGIGSTIARIAEEDESIQSEINTEEIEHAMKNVFEDMLDKVIDSKGFSELSNDEKWARFEEAYLEAAVESLSRKGMSKDSKDKIRETLRHQYMREHLDKLRGWVEENDVWRKWHSPNKKKKGQSGEADKKKSMTLGGSTLALLLVPALLSALASPHSVGMFAATAGLGMLAATISPRKPKPFKEALEELRLSDKELAGMLMLLKDMTTQEKPPLSGRIDELSRAYSGVTGPRGIKESVALVGKPGTGKTAIVEKLAQAAVMGQSHEGALSLKKMEGRYVVEVNSTRLMRQEDPAGTLESVMDILHKLNEDDPRAGNKVILFLDEAHVLFDGEKGKHVANTLKKPVRDGAVSIILATTLDEYKKYVEPDEALKRRFPAIFVDESTVDETLRALENASAWYEQRFGVKVDPSAMKAAAELAPKFNHEEYLPGSAFTYFENAVKWADFDLRRDLVALAIADKISDLQYAMKKLKENLQKTDRVTENLKKDEPTTVEFYNLAIKLSQELVALYKEQAAIPADGKPVVDGDLVGMAISRETGIKSGQLTLGSEPIEKYLKMEDELGKRVIGQGDAISAIARSVRQNKAGLSDPKRPLGVYYLTGPTGSGKTHLAKELARFLFDDPEAVVRVDMSEYMEGHSVSKFIGSPPGYVGFESGGQLTEAVRKKPYSVVLFDEIEKAHPQVWLIMLQILGEGRLTDGQGKTTSFKNTIILMTSNLGMHAVDVEPYVKAFNDLREAEKAAAGDRIKLRELEQAKAELAERLSVESKAATQVITQQAFKETYPPEFEGRLSAAPIVFNRITPAMALQIAELNLKELKGVLGWAGHEFLWTPGVVKKIVDEGFSVRLGARPLQNAIDRLITQDIASEILKAAQKNGGKVGPSRIEASLDDSGEIRLAIKPLPPKPVKKGEAQQGAAKDLFTTVLEQTLTAAADAAVAAPSLKLVDEWVKAALAANPDVAEAATEAPAPLVEQTPQAQAEAPADAVQTARPAQPAAPAKPGVMTIGAASPLSAQARSVVAAHNDAERKDPGVKQAAAAIKEALTQAGYPEAAVDALLRTVEDQNDPYVGFLKVFVEQAKRNGGGAPTIRYEIDAQKARVAVERTGALSSREKDLLTRHFTGLAPLDASQARTRAETWNVQDSGSGMRLMLDLHRVLAKIPGAKMGVETTAGGVEYWIELPAPPAPPPAPVETTPPPASAEATPPAPAAPATPLVAEAAGAPQWTGDAQTAEFDLAKRGLHDETLRRAIGQARTQLQNAGYGGEARGASMLFFVKVVDFLKASAIEGANVSAHWAADANTAQIQLRRTGSSLSEEEIARLKTLIESSTELRANLEAAGGRVYYLSDGANGASVWIQLPHTGAASQADGLAGAASEAGRAPVSEAALAKLKTIGYDPEKPGTFWVTFEGSNNTLLQPIINRGITNPETNASSGSLRRAKLVAPDAAAAGRAAAWLAGDPKVRVIGLHPDARAVAVPAPSFDVNALLSKIRASAQADGDPRDMWVEITAESPESVLGELSRQGFEAPVIRYEDGYKRAHLVAPSAAAAARAALVLAARADVRAVELHPQTRSLIRTTETSDPTTTPEGWLSVELDRVAPNDEDTELANSKRTILNAARGGEQAKAALAKFIDEAARKAKDSSENGDKIYLEWNVLPDQLEVSIRRKGGPVNPLAWTGWAAAAPFVAELSTANGVVGVEGGRHGGRFTLTLPMPRAASGERPAAGAPAMRATNEFKTQMVTLMRELIRQGTQRGLALRYTASEIVAEASSRSDMDWTADWLRFASDPEVTSVNEDHGPQVAAAGMVVAKHGSRSQDEPRLIAAMKKFSSGDSWDHARPARTRLIRSLAKLLTPGSDRQLQELIERYDRQKQSGLPTSEKLHGDVVLAIQTALLRNAGVDQFEKLVARDWNRRLMAETYDYVKRVKPEYLRQIYDDWKSGLPGNVPSGVRRLLALWAIADFGDRGDMTTLMNAVREGRWLGSEPDLQEKNLFGEALGRMAQRLGYDDALKHDARLWMREGMGSGGSYLRMVTAVQIAGAAGDVEDMPYLERIFRASPASGVSFEHEMTQMEATVAWGKLAQREGLVPEYWSTKQNPNDPSSLPLLQEWLTDTNSGVNMAAAEALLQFLKRGSPRRQPSSRTQGSRAPEDHPFLKMGAPDMPGGDERAIDGDSASDAALPYARLSERARQLATQWLDAFQPIVGALLGVNLSRKLVMSQNTSAGAAVFVLEQARGATVAAVKISQLRELVILLLGMARDPQDARERKLAELEARFPTIRAAYAALSGLMGTPGTLMGIDPNAAFAEQSARAEVWLKFEVGGRTQPRGTSFNVAHRHLAGDDDLPDGDGHMMF